MSRSGFVVAATCAALAGSACGGGGYQDNVPMPPGSDPPPGSNGGTYTDAAGRLYALVSSTGSGSTLVVLAARDGSSVGSLAFEALSPAGFAVNDAGQVYVGDAAADVVHVVSPDGGFGSSLLDSPDPRALAATESRLAIVAGSELTLSYVLSPIALPAGGEPADAVFSQSGSLLAIARNDPADVVLVSIGSPVSVAAPAPITSPDSCTPHLDAIAFPQFGSASSSSWHALDVECGHLFAGGATQDSAATVAFATPGMPAYSADRLAVDGWTDRVWISDGAGLQVVSGGVASPVPGVTGTTSSLALANAGTLVWVATVSSGGAPAITQVDGSAVSSLGSIGPPGSSVRALAYLDRPPTFTNPLDVTAPDCDVSTVSFGVSVVDPDGDPVDVWWVPGYDGQDASFDEGIFTGTFRDDGGYGPDGYVRFEAISGHFFAYAEVAVEVPDCPAPADPDDDDEDDGGGDWGCACQCTVTAPRGATSPLGSSLVLGLVAAAALRRRRSHV